MTCTNSYETRAQYEERIDCLLRDMVVEEALASLASGEDPRSFSLQEIADHVGLGFATLRNVEQAALNNFKKLMINSEDNDGG